MTDVSKALTLACLNPGMYPDIAHLTTLLVRKILAVAATVSWHTLTELRSSLPARTAPTRQAWRINYSSSFCFQP